MRQVEPSRHITIWERILRGYVWLTIAILAVYWFIRPFTPFWIDVSFIFICAIFGLVAFALSKSTKKSDTENNSETSSSTHD